MSDEDESDESSDDQYNTSSEEENSRNAVGESEESSSESGESDSEIDEEMEEDDALVKQWSCFRCTLINPITARRCRSCSSYPPEAVRCLRCWSFYGSCVALRAYSALARKLMPVARVVAHVTRSCRGLMPSFSICPCRMPLSAPSDRCLVRRTHVFVSVRLGSFLGVCACVCGVCVRA